MDLSQLQLFWKMTAFEALRFKAYPHEIFASLAARFAELALYCTFWLVIGQFSANQSFTPMDVISYYLIVSGLTPFLYSGFGFAGMTQDLIKNGTLTQALIRPINPIFYPLALRTGRNAINLLFGLGQVVIGFVLAGGLNPAGLPFLLPVLWNAVALNMAFNIIIGTAGFYTTEARGIKNASLHLASFARGEKMPLFLMTPELAGFLLLTPFPASQYHLATTIQGVHLPAWGDVLIGMAWSVALLFGALWLWRRGLRRYEAVGL